MAAISTTKHQTASPKQIQSKGQKRIESPSWSPAFLLAALEWADEDAVAAAASKIVGDSDPRPNFNPRPVAPQLVLQLAHKSESTLNAWPIQRRTHAAAADEPTCTSTTTRSPHVDVPKKLICKAPAFCAPPPSPISTVSFNTPVKFKLASSSPLTSLDLRLRYQGRQRPLPQQHQQRSERFQSTRWDTQRETQILADDEEAAQVEEDETERRIEVIQAGQHDETTPQSMRPSATTAVPPSPADSSPPHRRGMFDKVASLTRSRKKSNPNLDSSPRTTLTKRAPHVTPISPISPLSPNSSNGTFSFPELGDHGSMPDATAVARTPRSIAPQTDAPRGASNPGERASGPSSRQLGVALKVPVGSDTTAEDVLEACREEMERLGHQINADTSVLLEPCSRPALERRIRRYELIKHVMGSWDGDSQNTLIVQPDSTDTDKELSLSSVSKSAEAPTGFALPLYHSQRAGKWSKRYIILSEAGHMQASKKPKPKPSDKDVVSLCHLPDYDIYLPTEAEMRKQLRPPKKYCYAIKSQHRRSLFVDSDKYVHYFCTEDPNLALQFRTAVQKWRSWYLVHTKLQLYKQARPTTASQSAGDYSYRGRASIDIPSRKSFDSPRYRGEDAPLYPSKQPAVPPVPPLPFSILEKNATAFASNGLLGNGYDKRKHDAQRIDTTLRQRGRAPSGAADGPFVDGPNLLNRGAFANPISPTDGRPRTSGSDRINTSRSNSPESPTWMPSALAEYSATHQRPSRPAQAAPLSRRPSTSSRAPSVRSRDPRSQYPPSSNQQHHPPLPHHQPHHHTSTASSQGPRGRTAPPEPLIDLTPAFVEAPQWSREGRGRGVHAPQGTPLVDLATGPALAPGAKARFRDMPPQNPLRRGEVGGGGGGGGKMTLLEKYEMQKQQEQQQGQMQMQGGGRRRGHTITSNDAGNAGLVRRATVKSNGSSATGSGNLAAAYQSTRGRVMGVSEGDRERVRERLRSVDVADGGRAGNGRWKTC